MTEITIELDEPREVMYDELCEMFSEEDVEMGVEEQVQQYLTDMYDNREQIKEQAQQPPQ